MQERYDDLAANARDHPAWQRLYVQVIKEALTLWNRRGQGAKARRELMDGMDNTAWIPYVQAELRAGEFADAVLNDLPPQGLVAQKEELVTSGERSFSRPPRQAGKTNGHSHG